MLGIVVCGWVGDVDSVWRVLRREMTCAMLHSNCSRNQRIGPPQACDVGLVTISRKANANVTACPCQSGSTSPYWLS